MKNADTDINKTSDAAIERSLKTIVKYVRFIVAIVVLSILLSGITFVQADEVAIVLRLGKLVGNTQSEQILKPGFHFVLPYLIDKVVRVPVQKVHEVKIDSLFSEGNIIDVTKNGYALTGDNNLVLVSAVLKYMITEPVRFTLEVEDPEKHLQELAVSALTHEIAQSKVDDVLVAKKTEIQNAVLLDIQTKADELNLGAKPIAVEFIVLQPPREVKAEFDLVTGTYVSVETMIQQAKSDSEKTVLAATSERDSIIQTAKADGIKQIAEAKEDVAQVNGIIEEYRKNPEIVRDRIYREKVENIMSKVKDKIILPAGDENDSIMLTQ